MNRRQALRRVRSVFGRYKTLHPPERQWLTRLTSGKLYEFYCMAEVIDEIIQTYGYRIRFVGAHIKFKMSPAVIHSSDPHFDILDLQGNIIFQIYADIEISTLGSSIIKGLNDLSEYHEIDIAVVQPQIIGRPRHDQIALGVECKSTSVFSKNIVKEALGLRRELSLLQQPPLQTTLSANAPKPQVVVVPALPPSEYWLAFLDPKGLLYQASPRAFGIKFQHWQP